MEIDNSFISELWSLRPEETTLINKKDGSLMALK